MWIFRTMTLLNIPGFSVQVIDVKRSRRQRFRAHCLWFWDDSVKGRTRAKCPSLVDPRTHLCQTPECASKEIRKAKAIWIIVLHTFASWTRVFETVLDNTLFMYTYSPSVMNNWHFSAISGRAEFVFDLLYILMRKSVLARMPVVKDAPRFWVRCLSERKKVIQGNINQP